MREGQTQEIEQRIRERLDAGDHTGAATLAIRSYGPQVLSYLRAVLRDEDLAAEGFSRFGEGMWKGLAGFRGASSVLSWSYSVAWGAVRRLKRDPYRRRARRLATSEVSALAAELRESTAPYRTTAARDAVSRLRESLAPDEQTLIILRVDRDLPWKDVVDVFAAQDRRVDEAALRKRFERVKEKLRKLAAREGLIRPS
jgi:RNA polymerase sigma-70 factor (ECF subfamily)